MWLLSSVVVVVAFGAWLTLRLERWWREYAAIRRDELSLEREDAEERSATAADERGRLRDIAEEELDIRKRKLALREAREKGPEEMPPFPPNILAVLNQYEEPWARRDVEKVARDAWYESKDWKHVAYMMRGLVTPEHRVMSEF